MTSALQNRIVGTVILVALAVIFLPDFLDGKKEKNEETFASVPATPTRKPIVDPEPFPSDKVAKAAQRPIEVVDDPAVDDGNATGQNASVAKAEAVAIKDNLATQTVVNDPVSADEDGGWVVQLGSFRHQKNVKQLLANLENAGYRAFSRPIKTNSGLLTKVFVGPDLDKASLQSAIPHLQEITGLKGKVTRFKVE
ncbi:SPOR domain-containing protein [Alteromonas pelagimontana]|uniref:SPOR domain-containing protein n=1 Tax=Alteromonas pelagimontana TaxID=1858656 RepID=A0A6M4MGP3_9ALTE|nr:SPOR domain-containing protein [Alteromonas pelagimontana]QJR82232.1 SPOR domain-containing protein [Alteromonas pelagimontana]